MIMTQMCQLKMIEYSHFCTHKMKKTLVAICLRLLALSKVD